MNKKSQ